ncbi:Mitochondrial import inner membrane translocase subunit TIM50 [Linum perenne]
MASSVLRSRVVSIISRYKLSARRRFFSSDATSSKPTKESIIASESIIHDHVPASAAAATMADSAEPVSDAAAAFASDRAPGSIGWKLFKYGLIGTLTGATAYTGYVTYAYPLEEVEKRVKALRGKVNYAPSDDTSGAEKYTDMLYSAAMTVPAKAAELYLDIRRTLEEHVKGFTEPTSDQLLPDLHPAEQHVFTLVLDLNETLIYSDWTRERGWRTFKRPGVDDFLQHLAKFYEIVIYSDQLSMYVDPVVERLDTNHCIRYRLSRGATKYQDGKHYRDFSKLNRDPGKIIYVSGNAFESSLQPENCVPIKPFKMDDKSEGPLDTALLDLIPFLEYVARNSPADIRAVLSTYERKDIAKEFLERSKDYQRRLQEQKRVWRR